MELPVSKSESVKKEIFGLYQEPVQKIGELIDRNNLVVVTGPFGIGKSESLIPLLDKECERRGYFVKKIDCQEYLNGSFNRIHRALPKTNRGVVILDEASEVCMGKKGNKQAESIVTGLQNKGYKMINVIAYYAGRTDVRDRETLKWQESQKRVSDDSFDAYHMPLLRLDARLARNLLEAGLENQINEDMVSTEQFEYFLNNVPFCLRLYGLHGPSYLGSSKMKNLRSLMLDLWSNVNKQYGIWRGMLTEQEADILEQTLQKDLNPKRKF